MACHWREILLLAVCLSISWSASQAFNNETNEENIQDWIHGSGEDGCFNSQGERISHGSKYVPNSNDPCTECTCDKTFPVRCHSVACSPPQHCKPLDNTCCEYVCNGTRPAETEPDDGESITNLSLRLIASTVTSFLVLALLLFLVHRVRQRRLLLSMRRFEERAQQVHSEDTDSEHYIPEIFMSLECPPYTDPPPPYSPPKPPQILPGEEPPPYAELAQNADTNGNSADENRNQVNSLQERSSGQPHVEAYRLTELGRSGGRDTQGLRSNQQDTSLGRNCEERPGPHLERMRENVQLEQHVALHRPARANDYCMEVRREMEPGCVAYSLPAYACTDIVSHGGVAFTPEEAQANYFPSFAESCRYQGVIDTSYVRGQPHRPSVRSIGDSRPSQRQSRESHSRRRRRESSGRGSSYPSQTLPATTAFQKFSNLFKRNSWRAKNRRRHQNSTHVRGLSEMCTANTPAYYSTLPGGEHRPHVSNLYTGYDLSACNFYPTTASPSSSSSNSSIRGDQIVTGSNRPLGQGFLPSPNEASHWNLSSSNQSRDFNQGQGMSRRSVPGCGDRSHFTFNESHLSPYYPEQLQDDLRRHLPPACGQSTNFTPPQSQNNREISRRPVTCYNNVRAENIGPAHSASLPLADPRNGHEDFETGDSTNNCNRQEGYAFRDNHEIPGASVSHTMKPLPSTQTELAKLNPQRSLASLICSNLPTASAALNSNDQCDLSGAAGEWRNNELTTEVSMSRNSENSEGRDPGRTSRAPSEGPGLSASSSLQRLPHLPSSTGETHTELSAIRRSHSDTSEGSIFSVCSETGEQKLKGALVTLPGAERVDDTQTMTLPADSQYPQHPSLVSGRESLLAGKANNENTYVEHFLGCDDNIGKENNLSFNSATHSKPKTLSCPSDEAASRMPFGVSTSTDSSTRAKSVLKGSPELASSKRLDNGRAKLPPEKALMSSGSKFGADGGTDLNYNLNISPVARKRLASKDLQPVVGLQEEGRMVKSVNLLPLISHPCSLTQGDQDETTVKTVDSALCDLDSAVGPDLQGKDFPRKRNKKIANARRSSSPMALHEGGARQKSSLQPTNVKDSCGEINMKTGKSSRCIPQQKFSYPSDMHLSSEINDTIKNQFTGFPESYPVGAKVRAQSTTARNLSLQPGEMASAPCGAPSAGPSSSRTNADILLGMNDLNQPPKKLFGPYETAGSNNGPNSLQSAVSKQPVAEQSRRKAVTGQAHNQHHRRQASAGIVDKNTGRSASPSRRRPRPKSLAAPYEMDPGKYLKHPMAIQSAGLRQDTDPCFSRTGARSGFGCDLNLDDENGIADFHIHSSIASNQNKNMLEHPALVGTAMPLKQTLKPHLQQYNQEYGVGVMSQTNAVCGANTNTKSGPSKDLSFVGRSTLGKGKGSGANRSRRKQPLVASDDSSYYLGQTNENLPRNGSNDHWSGQVRSGNLTRVLSEEDVREATSYV